MWIERLKKLGCFSVGILVGAAAMYVWVFWAVAQGN